MESALQSIWFFLWGLLWALFFMTDGYDFGVGALLPFPGKDDTDKRLMINSIGPLWDGNEVWLITAGGVTFAAFPQVHAVMFSSFYTPFLMILFALIIRGVSFEFRGKIESPGWKKLWDTCIFIGSVVPAILFGVAFANIFQGVPLDQNGYHGNLIYLLNPYGILGGVLFLLWFLEHGALWLSIKTPGLLHERSVSAATIVSATFFCIIGLYPNMFPSNIDSIYSLTAYNASASQLTLTIMLVVVLVLIPIVIGYQVWAFYMFKDKLSEDDLAYEEAY